VARHGCGSSVSVPVAPRGRVGRLQVWGHVGEPALGLGRACAHDGDGVSRSDVAPDKLAAPSPVAGT